jgi:hypothetical protein
MKRTFEEIGAAVGQLVDEKNAAYGSSFACSGDFLRLLFPNGIPPSQYDDALLLVRIFDKQMRIATNRDAFGESPYQDIAGYGLLGTQLYEERKKHECPGSVSEQDARRQSKAQPDFAVKITSSPTTTSANATDANEPSQPQGSCSPQPEIAVALDVRGTASVIAAVLRGFGRNLEDKCANCGDPRSSAMSEWKQTVQDLDLFFDCSTCYYAFRQLIGLEHAR